MLEKLNTSPTVTRLKLLLVNNSLQIALVFGFAVAIGMFSAIIMPDGGVDMRDDILPSLVNWRSPWSEGTPLFPRATLMLMPFRFFSAKYATIIINFCSVIITALSIKRLGGNVLLTIPVFVSPIGYWMFTTGQTDAFVLAGFLLLPPGYDLLFFWKPQVILHAYWIRISQNPKLYLIAGGLLLIVSFLIWGNWLQAIFDFARLHLINGVWNRSLWPYSIPIGGLLLYQSIRKKDESYGIMASPLLSPYVNGPSYVGLAAVLAAKFPRLFLGIYLAFWLYVLYKR